MTGAKLTEIYNLLYERFGPQHWWPGETQFEIITGAILTQNTNWPNVEKAIINLKNTDSLTPEKFYKMDISELAGLIRPAGYYNIKAKRLKNFINWLFKNYSGNLAEVEKLSTERLREQLLSITGIGPETADSMLLYAFNRCVFVVDAYTARIITRHRLIAPGAEYEEFKYLFESNLPRDTTLFNEYHALLVRLGKEFCKTKARCASCPLEKLPHSLDIELF